MKKQPFYYLIVGYGNIGHKRHTVLGDRCIATVDPNTNSGATYKNVSEIPEKIIKDVDAVVITIPRFQKLAAVRYWLSLKKNVLVEKPFIITQSEARSLNTIAEKNQVIWYTAYNYRFEPNILKIKKLIERGFLGKLYNARMVYGFGNVQQLVGTWRDQGSGALEEIGCHLVDFAQFLFGYKPGSFEVLSLRNVEAKSWDHCLLSTKDRLVLMEASWIIWKNSFVIEIFGEHGSLHMDGLCKWGESTLIVRKRVLPAGVPDEKKYVDSGKGSDPTWKQDVLFFESQVKAGKNSCSHDLEMSQALILLLTQFDKKLTRKGAFRLLRGGE